MGLPWCRSLILSVLAYCPVAKKAFSALFCCGCGADVNAVDADGNNALMRLIIAADGHNEHSIRKELFAFLRDAGINLHARNKVGLNAAELNCSLYWPYDFLTQEFEKAGVRISPGARLAAAAAVSNVAEVERLLQQKADPNFNHACALTKCMGIITDGPKKNELIIAALLLQAGADPNLGGPELMFRAVHSDCCNCGWIVHAGNADVAVYGGGYAG